MSVCQRVSVDEWYSQVKQLRRDAEDYKRRGQQTHFSREHLAQLSARNAQLWDIVSNHRSSLLYMSVSLSACLSVCVCVSLSVCLSVRLCVSMSVCLSLSSSVFVEVLIW